MNVRGAGACTVVGTGCHTGPAALVATPPERLIAEVAGEADRVGLGELVEQPQARSVPRRVEVGS